MLNGLPSLQRFLNSQYFFSGIRQAGGVLIPASFASLVLHDNNAALVAAIGASCVAILDQPDNPRRHNTNTMLGAVVLGGLTVVITGLAAAAGALFWVVIPLLVFSLSMLSVYGKPGNLMAFACLLIMALTMRTPLQPQALMMHTLQSLAGGLFYFCYSFVMHRLLWHRETQQLLASALYATAEYVLARSRLYTAADKLDENYRKLTRAQSAMTDAHQFARNVVLRDLPRQHHANDRQRLTTLSIFTDMVDLLDTLVATHTDYATLHRMLPDHEMMTFARDALVKLANNLQHIALCVARNQQATEQFSTKAELRAFEYDLELLKRDGLSSRHPEVHALLVQVLRRLRNASRIVSRMVQHSQGKDISPPLDARLHQELGRFVSHNPIRLGMLTSNLRLDSPHFRYAVRVAIAVLLGLVLGRGLSHMLDQNDWVHILEVHSYWIILTIVVIMRPGFALTRQRNNLRLIGTGIGSLLALLVLNLTSNHDVMFAILAVSCVLGYSLVTTHFMGAAVFNTLTVVLAFQIMSPSTSFIIGERLIDTLIGCMLAWQCSYILPWWEANFMSSLARALLRANQRYFQAGMRYASAERALRAAPEDADIRPALEAERDDAGLAWRLARKNVHIAFSNFASAFYRMTNEPMRQQRKVPELNHLMIQHHVLAQQISAAVPQLAHLPSIPAGIQQALDTIDTLLAGNEADTSISLETDGDLAALAYPLRQMLKAAQLIRQEMRALEPPEDAAQGDAPQPAQA